MYWFKLWYYYYYSYSKRCHILHYINLIEFRFLIPQSQKATDIISKQIMDFIERDESWSILYNLLQQTIILKTRFSTLYK